MTDDDKLRPECCRQVDDPPCPQHRAAARAWPSGIRPAAGSVPYAWRAGSRAARRRGRRGAPEPPEDAA